MRVLKENRAMGAVGTVRSFMNVVKDIDFDEARDRAEEAPRTLIIGHDESSTSKALSILFDGGSSEGVEQKSWRDTDSVDPTRWDAIVVYDPSGRGLLDKVRKAVGPGSDNVVFFLPGADQVSDDPVEHLRAEVTSTLPSLAPAYGRFYPAWRLAAVRAIIDETSRANAKFALVSNVPAVIPVLGGIIAAGADLIVLTKNQVMMCYKIAAAHDRDLENQLGIIRELTPVVGAGFMWRTIAREAAAMVPLAAGTIPKVAIAFAGTMTTGRVADYYYRFGEKPSESQLAQFRDSALRMVQKLPFVANDQQSGDVDLEHDSASGKMEKLDVSSGEDAETQRINQD